MSDTGLRSRRQHLAAGGLPACAQEIDQHTSDEAGASDYVDIHVWLLFD
jgi:hypothetical protein